MDQRPLEYWKGCQLLESVRRLEFRPHDVLARTQNRILVGLEQLELGVLGWIAKSAPLHSVDDLAGGGAPNRDEYGAEHGAQPPVPHQTLARTAILQQPHDQDRQVHPEHLGRSRRLPRAQHVQHPSLAGLESQLLQSKRLGNSTI